MARNAGWLLIMNRRYVRGVAVLGPDAQNFFFACPPRYTLGVHEARTRPVSNLLLMSEIPPGTRPRTR